LSKQLEADGALALGAAESVVGITDAFKLYPDRRGMYCPNAARGLRVVPASSMPLKAVASAR
jgi:chemotaxis protein methyltransferase CheR